MDRETERLVNEVKKELRVLRARIEERENPKLFETYQNTVNIGLRKA